MIDLVVQYDTQYDIVPEFVAFLSWALFSLALRTVYSKKDVVIIPI